MTSRRCLRREQFGREPRDGLRRNAGARRKADAARHAGGEGAAAGADGAVYAERGKIRGHHLTTEEKTRTFRHVKRRNDYFLKKRERRIDTFRALC